METFELLPSDKNTDDMQEPNSELSLAVQTLDKQINAWLDKVFHGDSSAQALKAIVDAQAESQSRLKLKWH